MSKELVARLSPDAFVGAPEQSDPRAEALRAKRLLLAKEPGRAGIHRKVEAPARTRF